MSAQTVLVNTKNGPVMGRRRVTGDQIEYVSYQGIPFAKPPLGELRFKAPVPVDNWTAPIEALQQPAVSCALRMEQVDPRSSEDCLFLNIYTRCIEPNPSDAQRPVMLFIHGGGFMIGSTDEAMHAPDFLLRSDIVFVSVAYRLGALGFLSVSDPTVGVPGNAGLKDQALGMRWVRDNIAAFGGDASNVTLFGGSAGGASVHYHMLSEHSRGLFHRAVLQSGNALSMWAQQAPPSRDLNGQLARRLGWNGEGGVDGMMRVLRSADALDITAQQQLEDVKDKQRGHYFVFVPTVEPYGADTPGCFLPKAPEELAPTAWGNAVPMMCGFTADEGYVFYGEWKRNERMFDDDGYFSNVVPPTKDEMRRVKLTEQLVHAYYGEEKPSLQNLDRFAQLSADKFFVHGCVKSIRARERQPGSAPTYLYRFEFDSALPAFGVMKMLMAGEPMKGTINGEELMYLFKMEFVDYALPADSVELRVIDNMVNIWTKFAATGNPNGPKLAAAGVEQWPKTDKADGTSESGYKCLNIGGERLEVIEMPEAKRVAVWDKLECDASSSYSLAEQLFENLSK